MLSVLPKIAYSLDDNKKLIKDSRVISNIFRRIQINPSAYSSRINMIEDYHILDGDTPESISLKKYKDIGYWWTILVVNPQINSISDWPQTHIQIDKYLDTNYGTSQYDYIPAEKDFDLPFFVDNFAVEHHSIIKLNSNSEAPLTIRERLYRENELSRKIKLLTPELLFDFVREYEIAARTYLKGEH